MKREIGAITTILAMLLLAALPLIRPANAQTATVFVDCPDAVDIGTFQAKVNVSDVIGLYGWEFKLYYPKSLLNYTSYTVAGHFLENGGTTFQVDKSNRDYNATHGLIWLADSLLGAPSGVSGSGALVTLTFEALDMGPVELIFEDQLPLMEGKNIKLGDKSGNPIVNTAVDKTFNIVPEYTSVMLLSTIFAASAAAAIISKKIKIVK